MIVGRIARYLANKCSIASRIDSFNEGANTDTFGVKLRQQVEERLEFYKSGTKPRKNLDVMHEGKPPRLPRPPPSPTCALRSLTCALCSYRRRWHCVGRCR